MSVSLRTQNITKVYRLATQAERIDGQTWYMVARAVAEQLDPEDPRRAAAVLAVLSPRLHWERNVKAAVDAYQGFRPAVLGANADKAFRIISGEDPNEVVSGPKVRAFWHAITDPTDARAIVIDRHAFDVAAGCVLDDEQRGKALSRVGAYEQVAELYVRAAKVLSREFGHPITAVEVQATTWVSWRRMKKENGS